MVERRAESSHAEKLLAKLEALIRNGVRMDVPQAVNKRLEEYDKLAPDERERSLRMWIEAAHGRNRYFQSHVAWAVLKELSDRHLEREELPPWPLAEFAMGVHAGRIQEKHAQGRPPRSITSNTVMVAAHNILIEFRGYTMGEAQRRVASWMNTKPDAVAQIVSDWNRLLPELNSEKNSSI